MGECAWVGVGRGVLVWGGEWTESTRIGAICASDGGCLGRSMPSRRRAPQCQAAGQRLSPPQHSVTTPAPSRHIPQRKPQRALTTHTHTRQGGMGRGACTHTHPTHKATNAHARTHTPWSQHIRTHAHTRVAWTGGGGGYIQHTKPHMHTPDTQSHTCTHTRHTKTHTHTHAHPHLGEPSRNGNVNVFSLGLSNATEEQQAYSAIRDMPMLQGVCTSTGCI